jgi:glycosyltransferase involved in cell wall biosynthesis
VLITQIFPFEEVVNIKGASQAGNNFCHNFMIAGEFSKTYSLQLISEKKKKPFFKQNKNVDYICVRIVPHVGLIRFFNALIENIIVFTRILKSGEKHIWFYNVMVHNFVLFCLLRFLTMKKCFVLVADYNPELTMNKFSKPLLRRAHGIISLTQEFAKITPKIKNFIVIPGIINTYSLVNTNQKTSSFSTKRILFSGVLDSHKGIKLALDAFSLMPEYELIITGIGKNVELIEEYSKKYHNIKYLGYLKFDEYINVLNSISIVLSLRDTNVRENEFNFPSKIIEYFLAGKIVVSTKAYSTIDDSMYYVCGFQTAELKKCIETIAKKPIAELIKLSQDVENYANENFSYQTWHNAIQSIEQYSFKQ